MPRPSQVDLQTRRQPARNTTTVSILSVCSLLENLHRISIGKCHQIERHTILLASSISFSNLPIMFYLAAQLMPLGSSKSLF